MLKKIKNSCFFFENILKKIQNKKILKLIKYYTKYSKNYILTNINTIKALQIPELEDSAESIINKDLLGKVPAYLSTIKQTLKQQKEKQ